MSKARDLANAGTALTTVSATELGYLDGVTSAVQTQINAQIPKSTVTTKGDLLVATGSGTIIRQGVGTDGQLLAANSAQADGVEWVNPPASGSMTQLSTGSLTGTTVTISSISQSYKSLVLLITNAWDSSGVGYDLDFRLNGNSTTNAYGQSYFSGGSANFTQATAGKLSGNVPYSGDRGMINMVTFPFYTTSTTKKLWTSSGSITNSATGPGEFFGGGAWANTAAITSISIILGGGSFGSGGTYTLYGVN